jgi:hypothetical protein
MARDAHKGLMSRKADLESLVYVLMELIGQNLPWHREKMRGEKDKEYSEYILNSKHEFFVTYKELNIPQFFISFIEEVDKLEPGTEPDYNALKF